MSAFLDRVLLARAEEQQARARYWVRCVDCGRARLDADERGGLCQRCAWKRDPEARRARDRAYANAYQARKRAGRAA